MLTIEHRQRMRDTLGIVWFVIAVVVGAWLINALVFRSFSVTGPSMESTMFTGDRLIVNRLPMTWSALRGAPYMPTRGHVIVFKNPKFEEMRADEYVVKRVIGLPGEQVEVSGGKVTVYNSEHPSGFNPYDGVSVYPSLVTGQVDKTVVPDGQIFVIGDNRGGNESLDSRNGLGLIPLNNIVGPVVMRIYPFTKISTNF
ncbi:MAG: signal peptidase I [Candidatus Saccharimonadales bacterium]